MGLAVAARDELLDASVLFQEPVRHLLLWIAALGGFSPRWSERILDETGRNLLKKGFMSDEQWARLRQAMTSAFPLASVDQAACDALEDDMPNHPDDRHVLAAAVAGDIDRVVTNNLRHFRPANVVQVGKEAVNADAFLCEMLERAPRLVHDALTQQAQVMRRPRQGTASELLGRLAGLGEADALAPRFAASASETYGIKLAPPPRA